MVKGEDNWSYILAANMTADNNNLTADIAAVPKTMMQLSSYSYSSFSSIVFKWELMAWYYKKIFIHI